MATPGGAGGVLETEAPSPPPEEWPAVVGSPYSYGSPPGGSGAGGMPDAVTGGTMPMDQWVAANRGPRGFFSLMGDPTFQGGARLRTDLPGGGGGGPQGVIERGHQGVPWGAQAGANGLSTNNPNLMAMMGYADSGQRMDYLGARNVPMWIMRNGQLINVAEGWNQLHPSIIMGPSITRDQLYSGDQVGYPTASMGTHGGSIAGAGWPGQMNPWVTISSGRT